VSIAKVIEITSDSDVSFDQAIREGVKRVNKTVKNVRGAWIKNQSLKIENGQIKCYRVDLKVTFVLED